MKTSLLIHALALTTLWLGAAFGQNSAVFTEKLTIDRSDIKRSGSMPNTYAPVIKRVIPAVVSISSARVTQRQIDPAWDEVLRRYLGEDAVPQRRTQRQQQGLGSGVLVTSDGFIITNNHVIQGANEITVTLPKSQESYQAELIAADPSTDVALLKIDGADFPTAPLANSDLCEVGDVVLAVGNPFELTQTVTQGIVSAKGRSNVGPGGDFYGDFIQTDASINPGNSGGALVDSSGRVIGINSMIYSNTGSSTGIGFAIPINMAIRVVQSLLDEGRVNRGYLGINLETLDATMARRLGRRDVSGALIAAVVPDSPAAQAGLRPGDLIIDYQGRRVTDRTKLRLDVSRTEPGSQVIFGVVRDGQVVDIPITLGERAVEGSYVNRNRWDREPAPGEAVAIEQDDELPLETPFYLEGVSTQTLDDSVREQLGLDKAYEGAVVVQVNAQSPAGKRGLQVNDLIVEIGKTPITSTREALQAAESVEGNSVILGIIRQGNEQFVLVTK